MKISHIINPVKAGKGSDLLIAQPVTFETMKIARDYSRNELDVNLYSAQFEDDSAIIPDYFEKTKNLNRSILDIKKFKSQRKLPFIKDILDRLYDSSAGDYLIYTNVDIALMPNFYLSIKSIINEGYDAFIINRRTISKKYNNIDDIPLMYAQTGESHKGWDCFVFRRDLYNKFDLGEGIVGQGWIGRILLANMMFYSKKFKIFEDLHMTFHLGNDKSWKNDKFRDYQIHNIRECKRILYDFEVRNGLLDRRKMPGSFLKLEPEID